MKSTIPADDQIGNVKKLQTTPIAIIGMASIFPQSHNLSEYWDTILNKIDTIMDVPASRWNSDEYYDPDPSVPDKTYCKRGGFIPDILFDPAEFGLPPNLLEETDVSQLLSLVVAKECLEDAGYGDKSEASRENIGVILGMVGIGSKLVIPLMSRLQYPVWEKVLRSYGISTEDTNSIIEKIKLAYPKWEENSFPGIIGNVIAGRIANRFNLGGTNCVVDAACASSLAAIRMAVSELIEGRADMMITGGVDLDNSIGAYLCFSKTPAFSKGQHVRSFDKDSDGMMIGEGIGMVMLKRLADAQRDGDRIYAVIKAIGTSSDGRFKSIYAPSSAGQALALRRTYAEAGFEPSTVGLIEAHGTGTTAGDPAEFQALNEVFSENNPNKQYIALGSVKSQIGHTKAAAGVAGLIKASLALYHKVLPATINVKSPQPKLEIEKSPFYLNTQVRPWIHPARYPRRASVSAFGFGGTNFHLALEENENEQNGAYRINSTAKMVLLSAPTPADLLASCQNWSNQLNSPQAKHGFEELVTASLAKPIPQKEARVGFVAAGVQEAAAQLKIAIDILNNKSAEEYVEHPSGVYYRKHGQETQGKLVALFSGQGSQYINMGRELAINFPPIRQAFADMDSLFDQDELPALSSVVYPIPAFENSLKEQQIEKLTLTEYAQPAIGTLSAGLYKLLQRAGFSPNFAAGHSFGELTALWAAGVLSETDYFTLAKARGKAMSFPAETSLDTGTMLAVKGDINKLQTEIQAFPEVTIANWNSDNQIVLAGSKTAIAEIKKDLVEKGFLVTALSVSAAFHTPLVGHAQKPFAEAIKKVKFHAPTLKVYSNTSGQRYSSDPDQIRQTLSDHILNPVRFKDEIEAIYAEGGTIFVEFGPKNILTNLVKNILEGKIHFAVALNPNPKKDSDRQFREAVTQLSVLGIDLRQYDPYTAVVKSVSESKKSPISVFLNGGLYLTEKTHLAFEKAISEKNTLSLPMNIPPQTEYSHLPAAVSVSDPIPVPVSELTPAAAPHPTPQTANPDIIALSINQFQELQDETLKAHSQFLTNDGEYARIFGQLTQQTLNLLSTNSSPEALEQINNALQILESSMEQFHHHQAETLRVHEQYLRNQFELSNNLIQRASITPNLTDIQNIPPRPTVSKPISAPEVASTAKTPAAASNGNGAKPVNLSPTNTVPIQPAIPVAAPAAVQIPINAETLTKTLLDIVSEKTGYPTEMLDLGMDMEADLGIDSIKRVEILGAMETRFPELPKADSTALAEMHTLGQIVEGMSALTPETPAAAIITAPPVIEPSQTNEILRTVSAASGGVELETIRQALLEIVSEKTGYPTEMLDLGMDMEADLGIDSIKRVEILGAMETRFPELPKADSTALAEMHTLGQITDYLAGATSVVPVSAAVDAPAQLQKTTTTELPRGVVRLKEIPFPDRLEVSVPVGSICLMTDDGTRLTPCLADLLTKQGNKVIVLSLPENLVAEKQPLPEFIQRVQLADLTETGLETTLMNIQQNYGPAAIYIHLDPPTASSEAFSEKEKSIVKMTFLAAKFMKETLNTAAQSGYAAFLTVTHLDGQLGLESNGPFDPVSGGLYGLVKTLNLEWDKVFCRAIDFYPGIDPETAAGYIAAELYDPNRLVSEICYSPRGRFTPVIEPVKA